jgi:hypothetical protein
VSLPLPPLPPPTLVLSYWYIDPYWEEPDPYGLCPCPYPSPGPCPCPLALPLARLLESLDCEEPVWEATMPMVMLVIEAEAE